MSRTPIAVIVGLVFLAAYTAGVLALSDHVMAWHWLLQAGFFIVAGTIWVLPIYRLMLWAAPRRHK